MASSKNYINYGYGKFKDFEIRDVTYLGDPPKDRPIEFDLVKYQDCEPLETTNWETGEKTITTRYCFSIGRLWWNDKEPCFEFESIGLRYLENREDGLEEWLLKWCELKEYELRYDTEY